MAIKVNDDLHQLAMSANEIARAINMPRVRVHALGLQTRSRRASLRNASGVTLPLTNTGHARMLGPRQYFQRIVSAIRTASARVLARVSG